MKIYPDLQNVGRFKTLRFIQLRSILTRKKITFLSNVSLITIRSIFT
jgi:hypothetical protein